MMMKNYDESIEISHEPYIPDQPYRVLITGGSESGKNKCFTEFNKNLNDQILIKFIYM